MFVPQGMDWFPGKWNKESQEVALYWGLIFSMSFVDQILKKVEDTTVL